MSGPAPDPAAIGGARRTGNGRPALRLVQGGAAPAGVLADEDLHAWLDGALDMDGAARLEGRLSHAPDEAARAMAYRAQITGLHALYDPILDEPIPERLMASLRQVQPPEPPRARGLPMWPAVAAMALTAVVLGTFVLADGIAAMLSIL